MSVPDHRATRRLYRISTNVLEIMGQRSLYVNEHVNTEASLPSINEESSWVQNRHTDVVD